MDKRTFARHGEDAVTLQAAEWMLDLQGRDVSEERLAAWHLWLARDARHRQAFDDLQRIQESMDAMPRAPWPTAAEIEADRDARATDCHPAVHHSAGRSHGYWRGFALVAALAAIVAGATYIGWQTWRGRQTTANVIQTSVGELRRVTLADGSVLTAGARSRVAVRFAAANRDVQLEAGEAFFEVAPDATRPFVVHAGDTMVTAIGTAFNVRRSRDRVIVAVADGTVVATGTGGTAQLSAGEQKRFGSDVNPNAVHIAPVAIAAWRSGLLEYRSEPLADVVADLARYSSRRIVIEDPRAGALAVTGTVFEREIDKWLNSLGTALPVEVRTDVEGTVHIDAIQAD
jgi:transmembrane sensor